MVSDGIGVKTSGVMATNAALRLPLQDWVRRFDFWMSEQSPKASEQLSIIFDFRRVAGKLEAEGALEQRRPALVNVQMLNNGKPRGEAETDVSDAEAPLRAGKLLEDQGKKPEAIAAYTLSVKRKRSTAGIAALQRLGAPVPK